MTAKTDLATLPMHVASLRRINNSGHVLSVPSEAHDAALASLAQSMIGLHWASERKSLRVHTWARSADDMPSGHGWYRSQGSELGYDRWQAELVPWALASAERAS